MGKTVKLPISSFLLDEPHAHVDKLWGPYPSLAAATAAIPTSMKVASFKFGVISNGVFSEYIYLEDNGTPQELASLKVQLLMNPASGAEAGKVLSLGNDLKPVWVEPSSTAERVSFDNSEEVFEGDVSTIQAAIEALKDLLDTLDGDVVKGILVNGSEVNIENGVASITIPDAVTSVLANNELVFQTPDGQSVKGKVGVTTGADGLLHLTLTDEDGNTYSSPIAGLRVNGNALQYSNDGETWTTVQTFGKLGIKYVQASDPASGDVGDLALVGSTNAYVLKVYVGGSWQSLGSINSVSLVAGQVEFDNSTNGFEATDVQGAIEETQWSGKLLVGKNMNVAPAPNNHPTGYIKENGISAGSQICRKKMYKNNGYSRVLVKGYSTNNVSNTTSYLAIAFYTDSGSSNAPDYTTYIEGSGVAYTKASQSKEYFEAEVPSTAQWIVVSYNTNGGDSEVYFTIDNLFKDITNRLSDVEHIAGSEYDKIKRNAVLSIGDAKTLGKGIEWSDGSKYTAETQGYYFLIEGVTHIYAKILNRTSSCANIAFYRKAVDGEASLGTFDGYVYMQDKSVRGSNEHKELELISEIPSNADLVCVTSYRTYEQQDNEPIVDYTPEIYLSCDAPSVRLNTQIKQNTENVDAIQSRLITQFPFACHLSLTRTPQAIRFKPRNNAIIRVQYSFDSWSLTNTSSNAVEFFGVKEDGTPVNLASNYESNNGVNFPNNSKYSIKRSSLKSFPLGYGLKREDSIIFPIKDVNSGDEFVEYYLSIKGEPGSEVDVALIDDGLNNIVDRCGGALYLQNKLQSLHKLLKSSGDKDPVTLLYFSDIHNANDALKQIMEFYNLKGISSYVEDVLCGGDCVADHSVEYITEEGVTTTVKMEYPFYDTAKAAAKAIAVDVAQQAYDDAVEDGDPQIIRDADNSLALAERAAISNVYDSQNVLIAVGNHDCLAKHYPENTNSELTAAELYDDTISNLGAHLEYLRDNKGIELEQDATYYYKDYTTEKTVDGVTQIINRLRLIVLDCMHPSQTQKDWFEDTLSDAAENGFPVIVCEHYKPSSKMTYIDSPFSSLEDSNTDSFLVGENAAKDTTSYLAIVDNAIDNEGLDFVCWLYGHEHKDYFGYLTRHTNQYAVCIGKTAPPENDSNRDWTLLPSYVKLNMISVHPSKKILTVWRIGSNGDIFGREKELIVFDYGNKTIISNY